MKSGQARAVIGRLSVVVLFSLVATVVAGLLVRSEGRAAAAPAPPRNAAAASERYDVVIRGGRVMDPESGLDAIRNVGITGGTIRAISAQPLDGRTVIDAAGLVVAPGFIDLHQHGQDAENYALKAADGVTTALELEVGTADVDQWYAQHAGKALINYGVSIGHIQVRMAVMHELGGLLPSGDAAHRAATPAEIEQMKQMIAKGLDRGALAVGFGPAYTAGASNWEIVEMFRVAARYGASCHVHIRGAVPPAPGNMTGFEEVLACAAATGAPLHVVHIQSTGGADVAHELEMIDGARARGMDVTTECYPYTHGMTDIKSALFDHREDESDNYFAGLLWPQTGEHLTRESFLRYRKQGGMVILPANTQENVDAAVASPLAMIASDGIVTDGKGHPRTAGTYARVLGRYVRERHALTLMEALGKMTLMPAERLEHRDPLMRNKGRVRVGADADLTVFDPQTVIDRATYGEPTLHSAGIAYVLVNGVPVVKAGQVVEGVYPGQAVRAPLR
ncbi:MAG TPA: amidohydrolase family protein [Candidatus Acidoferrales bacterium]|nr:amidohydrolase family protein [Candidatus Acidoferrales bacterium]